MSTTMNILMVGKVGNGKSSCIQNIKNLRQPNSPIIAEECRGVRNMDEDFAENVKRVVDNVWIKIKRMRAIAAIAFVIRYGVRFSKLEKEAADVVKMIFGDDVFRKYGIIIMTCGDLFALDKKDDGRTFMEWCRVQTGEIQTLFEEVNYRIVLFDNKTREISRLKDQYNALYDLVKCMNVTYGRKQFQKSKYLREELMHRETTVNRHKANTIMQDINNRCICMGRQDSDTDVCFPDLVVTVVFMVLVAGIVYYINDPEPFPKVMLALCLFCWSVVAFVVVSVRWLSSCLNL